MKINLKFIVIITGLLVLISGLNLSAQEEKSIDTLVGLAIQKYLEGDIKLTISYLDEVLTRQPDHKRAKELIEKAVIRLASDIKANRNFSDIPFIEIGQKHLPDSESITANMEELKSLMGVLEREKIIEAAVVEKIKKKLPVRTVKSKVDAQEVVEYKKTLSKQDSYIRKLERKLAAAGRTDKKMTSKVEEIRDKIGEQNQKLMELGKSLKKSGISLWAVLILVVFGLAGGGIIYITLKSENVKLFKNIISEKKTVEELKAAYNKDMQELAKRLTQYGKSQMRADELEKNWEKVLNILESLTSGGSTGKVVLKNSPDGRKAVTGVDPRIRARADSVEVIAEVFKDSPKATEMLRPFLDDRDNRTRANAAVAYYRYDQEKAMTVLQDMAASDDKWMRLSVAWALGRIGDTATSKLLEKLLDDADTQVKNKARISLEKILEKREEA